MLRYFIDYKIIVNFLYMTIELLFIRLLKVHLCENHSSKNSQKASVKVKSNEVLIKQNFPRRSEYSVKPNLGDDMLSKLIITSLSGLILASGAYCETLNSQLLSTDNQKLGTIEFRDTPYGLLVTPNLQNLPTGLHGFHIHEHPDCGDHALKAMGHLDPKQTGKHLGPYAEGHLGDLPVLVVDDKGQANTPILAPRLKTSDIKNHAVMVHAGGDNYSDEPKLGGGGERIGCGIIKQ
jgi:Cu-Zn family superoxide dismutase